MNIAKFNFRDIKYTPVVTFRKGVMEQQTDQNPADGFYYYHVVTAPGTDYAVTETLFDAVKIGTSVTQNFDITIYQEAVFAEGYEAGAVVDTDVMVAAFAAVNK